jgi:hypothetical protein
MPSDPLAVIVSGADFSLDDGPYLAGQPGNFESHICNGQCANTSDAKSCTYYDGGKTLAQVWNWGYDAIYNTMDHSKLPKKICIQAFSQNILTQESGKLPAVCNDAPLTVIHLPRKVQSWKFMYPLYVSVMYPLLFPRRCRAGSTRTCTRSPQKLQLSSAPRNSAVRTPTIPGTLACRVSGW